MMELEGQEEDVGEESRNFFIQTFYRFLTSSDKIDINIMKIFFISGD